MRPPEPIRIIWRDEAPYEAAAELIAALAYADDQTRRRAFANALAFLTLRETLRGNAEWVAHAPGMSTLALEAEPDTAVTEFARGIDLVNRRMLAAAMLLPALFQLRKGVALQLRVPGGTGVPTTITNLALEAQKAWARFKGRKPPKHGGNPNNAMTELWRPARPVLHLALGLTVAIHNFEQTSGPACRSVTVLLDEPQLAVKAAIMAEEYRRLLPELGRMFRPPAQLSSETAVPVSIDRLR